MRKLLLRLAASSSQLDSPSNNFAQLFSKFKNLKRDSLPNLMAIFQHFINNAQQLKNQDLKSIGWDLGKAFSSSRKFSTIELCQLLDKSALYNLLNQHPELRNSFAPLAYNIYTQIQLSSPCLSETLIYLIFELGMIYTLPQKLLLLLQELYKKKPVKSNLPKILGIMLRHNYQSDLFRQLDIQNLTHEQIIFLIHNKLIKIASSIIDRQKFVEANNYRYIPDLNVPKSFILEAKVVRSEWPFNSLVNALSADLDRPAVKRMALILKPIFKDELLMINDNEPMKESSSLGRTKDLFYKAGYIPKYFYNGPYMPSIQFSQQKIFLKVEDQFSKVYVGPDQLKKSAESKYRDIFLMNIGSSLMNIRGMQPEIQMMDMIRVLKQIRPCFIESV